MATTKVLLRSITSITRVRYNAPRVLSQVLATSEYHRTRSHATGRSVSTLALIADNMDPVSAAASALVVPGPMATQFLQVAPAVLLQFVFIAPLQAMRQFRVEGTTGDVSPLPYAAMVANGSLWLAYGALLGNPTIMLPNVTAIILGAGYCATFWKYRSATANPVPYFAGSAAAIAVTTGVSVGLPTETALSILGYSGCAVCVLMFGGPLAAIKSVLRDRTAASMPLGFTVASFANTSCWLAYGLLVIHDPFIWAPNILGLASSVVQLGLYARFGAAPPAPPTEDRDSLLRARSTTPLS